MEFALRRVQPDHMAYRTHPAEVGLLTVALAHPVEAEVARSLPLSPV